MSSYNNYGEWFDGLAPDQETLIDCGFTEDDVVIEASGMWAVFKPGEVSAWQIGWDDDDTEPDYSAAV